MNKSDKYRTAVIRMAKGIHRDIRMDDTDCPWLRVVLPSRYGNCAVLFEFNTWQIEGLLCTPYTFPRIAWYA